MSTYAACERRLETNAAMSVVFAAMAVLSAAMRAGVSTSRGCDAREPGLGCGGGTMVGAEEGDELAVFVDVGVAVKETGDLDPVGVFVIVTEDVADAVTVAIAVAVEFELAEDGVSSISSSSSRKDLIPRRSSTSSSNKQQ